MRLIDADKINFKGYPDPVQDKNYITLIPLVHAQAVINTAPTINADDYFDAADRIKPCPNCRHQVMKDAFAESPWISVKERLPKNDYGKHWKDRKYYLVKLAPSGLMRVAKFGVHQHDWWVDSHSSVLCKEYHTEVTHWMSLPELPKE